MRKKPPLAVNLREGVVFMEHAPCARWRYRLSTPNLRQTPGYQRFRFDGVSPLALRKLKQPGFRCPPSKLGGRPGRVSTYEVLLSF